MNASNDHPSDHDGSLDSPKPMPQGTRPVARLRREKSVKQIANPQKAQSNYSKLRLRLRRLASFMQEEEDDTTPHTQKQSSSGRLGHERYRIRSINHDQAWFDHTSEHLVIALLTNYFKWTFRSSFLYVILSACALFVLWSLLFAIAIYLVMRYIPECIVGTEEYFFVDAYHLSWTTLSTVGYGLIGPTVGLSSRKCFGVNALMAYESFFGVLYASLVGAVVFSKIARIQSVAAVRFSRVICVRHGTGVQEADAVETDEEGEFVNEEDAKQAEQTPCPILEFRLINGLSHSTGGEIIDAAIRVVACVIDEDDEHDTSLRGKQGASKRSTKQRLKTVQVAQAAAATLVGAGRLAGNAAGKTIQGARKIAESTTGNIIQQVNWAILHQNRETPLTNQTTAVDAVEAQQQMEKELQKHGSVSLVEAARTVVPVNEGNSKLLPPRKYHKLQIETDQHPYFNRSWIIRHTLDETSPLLSAEARRRIAAHQGVWPFESYQDVRQHLKFTQMIVTFSGTANASGNSVYAQTVYNFESVFVGYVFANLLTRQKGRWVVDSELIDDIREQKGGGAEPIDGATNVVSFRSVPVDDYRTERGENEASVSCAQMSMIPEDKAVLPEVSDLALVGERRQDENARPSDEREDVQNVVSSG